MDHGILFSDEPELFAIQLKRFIDFVVSHRNIFPEENAVVIPRRYADDVVRECGCSIVVNNPYLICEYKDFKIFTSPYVNDKDVWFTETGGKLSLKDIYAPYLPLEEESK